MQEPPRGEDVPITIFLGDMHAPVATTPANAHIVENGWEMLRGRLAMRPDELPGVPPLPGSDRAKLGYKAGQRTAEALQELQWNEPTTHGPPRKAGSQAPSPSTLRTSIAAPIDRIELDPKVLVGKPSSFARLVPLPGRLHNLGHIHR